MMHEVIARRLNYHAMESDIWGLILHRSYIDPMHAMLASHTLSLLTVCRVMELPTLMKAYIIYYYNYKGQ